MLGVEIVDVASRLEERGARPAHPKLASTIQSACLKRGLILELGGRHGVTVRLLPPLIITEAEVDCVAEIMAAAIRAAVESVDRVAGAAVEEGRRHDGYLISSRVDPEPCEARGAG